MRTRLSSADGAFIGRLLEVKRSFRDFLPQQLGFNDGVWKFRVENTVKGNFHIETPVQAPLHGAACGLDLAVGERAGVFVYREGSAWTSGLCSKVSPDALTSSSEPPHRPVGGEIDLILSGEGYGNPITALTEDGEVVAYGSREERTPPGGGTPPSLTVCPGSRFAIENDVTAGGIYRRNLNDFKAQKVLATGRSENLGISCRNHEGSELLVVSVNDSGDLEIQRLTPDGSSKVADGLQNLAFHPSKNLAYSLVGRTLYSLDLVSQAKEALLDLSFRSSMLLSPSGEKMLALADLGHDAGTHLMLIDLVSRSLQTEVRREWSWGPIAWLDDKRFAFSVVDKGVGIPDDRLYIYDTDLQIVQTIRGFGAKSIAALEGSVYGMAGGRLLKVTPGEAKVESLTSFDSEMANIVAVPPPAPLVNEEATTTLPKIPPMNLQAVLLEGRSPDFSTHARWAALFYTGVVVAISAALLIAFLLWRRVGRRVLVRLRKA